MAGEQEVRRGTASARLLIQLAGEHGVPAAACLEGSGIAPVLLEDPLAEIDTRQDLAVVRNVARLLRHVPGIGLEAGARYPLTAYGIWGYALLSSRTLRSALELGGRYIDLTFTFFQTFAVSEPAALTLVFDDRDVPEECRQFLLERDMAAAVAICRALALEPVPLRRVSFRFPAPAWADRFGAFFSGPVRFGAEQNAIVIDAAWADRRLPQANEQTAQLCEEQCRHLLDQRRRQTPLSERVRRQLLRPGAIPAIESVAGALAMAPRSLQRGLEDEKTTFRALVAEVRRALAEEMLLRRMTVEEVAERLGYAEAASFVHAFKRWTGKPPGRYRRTATARAR